MIMCVNAAAHRIKIYIYANVHNNHEMFFLQ